jgi:hypothetical protein
MAAEGTAHIEEIFGVNLQRAMQVHKRKAPPETYEKAKLKVSRGFAAATRVCYEAQTR